MPVHRVICGNTLEVLRKMESELVDCVVTSPPYWNLRDYQVEGHQLVKEERDVR